MAGASVSTGTGSSDNTASGDTAVPQDRWSPQAFSSTPTKSDSLAALSANFTNCLEVIAS